jgi:mono/diheme cytochrome c family protein/glucose/arabinose dehydrogenase
MKHASTRFEFPRKFALLSAALLALNLFAGEAKKPEPKKEDPPLPPMPPVPALTPEETLKTFKLPDGYRLEPVVTDPDIKEPVQTVFDGNGRMYIAEMRSYMQDIDATDEHASIGRVSRHESTKGDGVYDKHTVFADKLKLPRMIMPLDDRLLINQTDTNDIFVYRDTNGDGVSDTNELFFQGGPRGGNLEHQPSGLIWCMDNWIYSAGNAQRLRFVNNTTALKEPTASNGGQWGMAMDDNGKPWFSNGGGERGFINYQTHILYAAMELPGQAPNNFLEVYPLVPIPDVQGGPGRFRPEEKTLNHMTASCGNEIFRGDRLPADLRGNALICEPVGRLIRRAVVEVKEGVTYLSNPYDADKSEFIRSTDPNFRPVNMTTGPDGCLYITDMYRGIIQEGNWTQKGSYLRKVIQQYSLDKNVGRGRIWRLVHKDFKPGPQPHMLDETPAQLVAHLEHPNGWWRDTAQKLIILKGDKSVVPALTEMAKTNKSYLARMHAIWTLEGLESLDKELLREKFKDENPNVRVTAIRASEGIMKKGESTLQPDVQALLKDPDANVVVQVMMTAKLLNWPDYKKSIEAVVETATQRGPKDIGTALLKGNAPISKDFSAAEQKILAKGAETFKELCFGCHGLDGRGAPLQGGSPGQTMAPPLGGSKLLMSHRDAGIYVLMNGLTGPLNGKEYTAQMVPMNTNTDDWIASVLSYVRNNFGNRGAFVTVEDVKRIRPLVKARTTPWTRDELTAMLPQPLKNEKQWKVSASHKSGSAQLAIDGDMDTRYDTGASQAPNMWYQIELPEPTLISGLRLDAGKSSGDYPRGYKVQFSSDGKTWDKPVAEGKGEPLTDITFTPVTTKFIRITQTGSVNGLFWSIHELQVISGTKASAEAAPAAAPTDPKTASAPADKK